MSTDILALDPKQLEAMAAEQVATEASASGSIQMLSTRNGRLTLKGMPIVGDQIRAIILCSPIERNYYAGAFSAESSTPPDCFALSNDGITMGPSARVATPMSPTCHACPKNQWGSSTAGSKKGKACKETRKIVLLDAETIDSADQVATAPIYGIRPPVTSVTAFSTHVKQIAVSFRKPAFAVETLIKLVPDNKNQFRMEFSVIKEITDTAMLVALMERSRRELDALLAGDNLPDEVDEGPVMESPAF